MQERQVTIGDNTFVLDEPFLVMATQNPIEQEGTYPLPEAQVDRFLMKVIISYPTKEEEKIIIRQNLSSEQKQITPLLRPEDISEAQKVVEQIFTKFMENGDIYSAGDSMLGKTSKIFTKIISNSVFASYQLIPASSTAK